MEVVLMPAGRQYSLGLSFGGVLLLVLFVGLHNHRPFPFRPPLFPFRGSQTQLALPGLRLPDDPGTHPSFFFFFLLQLLSLSRVGLTFTRRKPGEHFSRFTLFQNISTSLGLMDRRIPRITGRQAGGSFLPFASLLPSFSHSSLRHTGMSGQYTLEIPRCSKSGWIGLAWLVG